MTSPVNFEDFHHHIKKKRVGKACDSCRIKKTKCDGKKPCNRCLTDNKICIFTVKKKLQHKRYPTGYVELLETRIELLTKCLEKLIELSKYNLPFLQKLAVPNTNSSDTEEYGDDNSDNEYSVPINKVVLYLINNENLFSHLPVEWERGVMIAANYDEQTNLTQSIKEFADNKSKSEEYPEADKSHVSYAPQSELNYKPGENLFSKSSLINDTTNSPPVESATSPGLEDTSSLNNYFLGTISRKFLIENYIDGGNYGSSSEFESDSNSNFNKSGMNGSNVIKEALDWPKKSLFFDGNATSNSDLNDLAQLDLYLTNRFKSQQLSSPASERQTRKGSDEPNLLKRATSLTTSFSTSSEDKGFVHKPLDNPNHHNHVAINPNSPISSASNCPASLFNNFKQKEELAFDQTHKDNQINGFETICETEQEYSNDALTSAMGEQFYL